MHVFKKFISSYLMFLYAIANGILYFPIIHCYTVKYNLFLKFSPTVYIQYYFIFVSNGQHSG